MKVQIGPISIEPGAKGTGFLKVSNNPDGSQIGIPLIAFHGGEEGPTLCIDAGVHGSELEGVEAVMKLGVMIDPKKLRGTLILVPCLNVAAFNAKARTSPIDNVDMNRIFPGKPGGFVTGAGTITHKLANVYFNEIVCKCNYLINCHNSGNFGAPLDFAGGPAREFGEVSKKALELAKTTRASFILLKKKATLPGSIVVNCAKKGIPAILLELGAHSVRYEHREYWVNQFITSFTNVMKYLDMLEGKPELRKHQIVVETPGWFKTEHGGMWFPRKKVGDKVEEDEIIGTILNPFFGQKIGHVKAPYDGVVLGISAYPVCNPGGSIAFVGKILKEIKR